MLLADLHGQAMITMVHACAGTKDSVVDAGRYWLVTSTNHLEEANAQNHPR